MEFLRFGSSIPGSYWGCCAVCIIQNFKMNPDDPASIELVCGDGGEPIDDKFLGKTWKEVFEARLRIGTFSDSDMPNHAFLAVMTADQIRGKVGKGWLKILKENGFEFVRAVSNSVYEGSSLLGKSKPSDGHLNYIFGLFRNIGRGAAVDPFRPPYEWTELDGGVSEVYDSLKKGSSGTLQKSRNDVHLANWNRIGKIKTYSEEQLEAANVPVWYAGRRSTNPQELAQHRKARADTKPPKTAPAPFASTSLNDF
jgi:hypothetical protein